MFIERVFNNVTLLIPRYANLPHLVKRTAKYERVMHFSMPSFKHVLYADPVIRFSY